MKTTSIFAWLATSTAFTNAVLPLPPKPRDGNVFDFDDLNASTSSRTSRRGRSHFSQLIDHSNPSLGTFQQWFAWDTTHYAGPGSPIVLFTPGEEPAKPYGVYLTNWALTGVLAEQIGGATILLEHRYFGTSSPFTELTTANMSYMTLENSIYDITNFAENVELPFDLSGSSNAPTAPWVMMGASYSGALTAWVQSVAPGTLWAYQASSAVVEVLYNYWGYYKPVELGMPKNCSKDVILVVEYMDNILTTGSEKEVKELKTLFGLESIEHNDDFMNALSVAPQLWQSVQFIGDDGFYRWCDFIEGAEGDRRNSSTKIPGAEGVGLQTALHGYAEWIKRSLPDYCHDYYYPYFPKGSYECFNTYNASSPLYTDTSIDSPVDRGYQWMSCGWVVGWFQTGPPANHAPGIVSRLLTEEYWMRQCGLYFPPGPEGQIVPIDSGRRPAFVNSITQGWNNRPSDRLQYTNGQYDPWREVTVSSNFRPGGPLQSTPEVPVLIVPDGHHGDDLVTGNGVANKACKEVQDAEIAQLVAWVNEFPSRKLKKKNTRTENWRA